jgi:hypothetical protein
MNSEFPMLDLLDKYGLRSAYLIMMLGARSTTHFQHLHDEVIPLECRLPRNLFIALKKERERMLDTGDQHGYRDHLIRPSKDVLLREFNRARYIHRMGGPVSFRHYFVDLLKNHWSGKVLFLGDIWNHDAVLEGDHGSWYNWVSCKLNGVPCTVSISFHLSKVEANPPEGIVLPKGYVVTKSRLTFQIFICFASSQINYLGVQTLLELPEWNQVDSTEESLTIHYQFELPEQFELSIPNTIKVIEITEAKLGELIALVRSLGIPLELVSRPAPSMTS